MRNIRTTWLVLALTGILCMTFGFIFLSGDAKAADEARRFQSILSMTEQALRSEKYDDLPRYAQVWLEISETTKNPAIKWKSLYNNGRTNLETLERAGDENAYRSGRRNLREALRENPGAFDAKYNLTYLENLAQEKGIEPEEIPVASKETPTDDPGSNAPLGALGADGEETKPEKVDLKDRISTGRALGIGGEPPLDITSKIDPVEIPKAPKREY